MRLQLGRLTALTCGAMVTLGVAVWRQWAIVQMISGLAMLLLVSLLAFRLFLASLLREPWT